MSGNRLLDHSQISVCRINVRPERPSRGEGSLLKRQKPTPTTLLSCLNRSFAKTVAHMVGSVETEKVRAKGVCTSNDVLCAHPFMAVP